MLILTWNKVTKLYEQVNEVMRVQECPFIYLFFRFRLSIYCPHWMEILEDEEGTFEPMNDIVN
mgnify:CR=1 FL=1